VRHCRYGERDSLFAVRVRQSEHLLTTVRRQRPRGDRGLERSWHVPAFRQVAGMDQGRRMCALAAVYLGSVWVVGRRARSS
jgi:hypothetical protein